MKKLNIFYWICTSLLVIPIAIGSFFDAIAYPDAVQIVTQLGYPAYLVPFLGVARLLAIIVILLPKKYKLLKEWAYAGLSFDMAGALYSHIALGEAFWKWLLIMPSVLFLTGSYWLYHRKLTLIRSQVN